MHILFVKWCSTVSKLVVNILSNHQSSKPMQEELLNWQLDNFSFFSEVHEEHTKLWCTLFLACVHSSASAAFTFIDGTEKKGYEKIPPLEEAVSAHLSLSLALGWKSSAAHPSKTCRTTSALVGPTPWLDRQSLHRWPLSLSLKQNQSPGSAPRPQVLHLHQAPGPPSQSDIGSWTAEAIMHQERWGDG